MDDTERSRGIKGVLWGILWLNMAVAAAKMAWGLVSGSAAMTADGVHSLTDGSGNVVALIAMRFAGQPLDEDHPYGHHKYESLASAAIGVMLVLAAWRVGSGAVDTLALYARTKALPPVEVSAVSFAVMLVTLAINVFVVWYERKRGTELGSDVLQTDAKHTLSDIWVTMGVLLSLILVKLGVVLADPIVSLFVAFVIAWAALGVLKGVLVTFTDAARVDPRQLCEEVLSFEGVRGCHNVRTRGTDGFIQADLSILVDPDLTVEAGHAIAHDLELWLCRAHAGLRDVVVHVEPDNEYQRSKPFLSEKKLDAGGNLAVREEGKAGA